MNVKELDRRVRVAELILRCLILGLALLAAVLIGSDSQVNLIFSISKKATFRDMKSLVLVVITNGVAAGYSMAQVVRCGASIMKGSYAVASRALGWCVFCGDQAMAYVAIWSLAAAMQSGLIAEYGMAELQWMRTCDLYRKFCTRSAEGMVSAGLGSVAMIGLSFISAFTLFRLYNNTNANINSSG